MQNDNSPRIDTRTPTTDLYRLVHRGLRWGLSRALSMLGAVDLKDHEARADALQEVITIVEMCGSHVRHEETFIHEAIRRAAPNRAESLEREHAEHFEQIDDLKRRAATLNYVSARLGAVLTPDEERSARPGESRQPSAASPEELRQELYLRLGSFIAENLDHMRVEEEIVQPLLDANLSALELTEIHERLVRSLQFDELVLFFRVMLPAATATERLDLLAGPKAGMPSQVFAALLWQSSTHLSDAERAVLVERLEDAA
jgi:hypothetical protein